MVLSEQDILMTKSISCVVRMAWAWAGVKTKANLHYTQAQKQTSGDPSGVKWNYRGITLLYKFTTPCYICCYQSQRLELWQGC